MSSVSRLHYRLQYERRYSGAMLRRGRGNGPVLVDVNASGGQPERHLRKWLAPGIGIKRWFVLLLFGMGLLGLGVSFLARELYLTVTLPSAFYYITLQFLPYAVRGAILIGLAVLCVGFGIGKFTSGLVVAARSSDSRAVIEEPLVELLHRQRFAGRGIRIVCIGGGTGLSVLLRGLKTYTDNLSAVVSVADDGGSSGRLRRDLGIIPPGDLRNCIAALADAEPLMTRLFQYRFPEGSGNGLEGHSFGNLFLVAMSDVAGSMEEAIHETVRVLAVRGKILPSTLENIRLAATTADGERIRGESSITEAGRRIAHLNLEPRHPAAYPETLNAIRNADLIVVGPGSLLTSVLPNLLVPDIRLAFQESDAMKLYISNVATQHGETDHFSVQDHVRVITEHIGGLPFDAVVANSNSRARLPRGWKSEPVHIDCNANRDEVASNLPDGVRIIEADIIDTGNRYRHDSAKLADAIMTAYHEGHEAGVRPRHSQRVSVPSP